MQCWFLKLSITNITWKYVSLGVACVPAENVDNLSPTDEREDLRDITDDAREDHPPIDDSQENIVSMLKYLEWLIISWKTYYFAVKFNHLVIHSNRKYLPSLLFLLPSCVPLLVTRSGAQSDTVSPIPGDTVTPRNKYKASIKLILTHYKARVKMVTKIWIIQFTCELGRIHEISKLKLR